MDWNNFLIFFTQKGLIPQTEEEAKSAIIRQDNDFKMVNKGKLTGGDRIEREGLKFHNNVRKGFLELAKKYPKRIKKIRTNEEIEKTQIEINKEIDKFFKKKNIYV